jgi:hypothetical protein
VFLSLPHPRFAVPQALDRGEDRLTSVTFATVSGVPGSLRAPLVDDFRLA